MTDLVLNVDEQIVNQSCTDTQIHVIQNTQSVSKCRLCLRKIDIKCLVWILIYIAVQAGLIEYQMNEYKDKNICVKIARVFGILISFNMAIVVFLVFKRTTTLFRSSKIIRMLLPLDQFLCFHIIIACLILLYGICHTVAHATNLYLVSIDHEMIEDDVTLHNLAHENHTYPELLFTTKSDIGWLWNCAIPSGWAVLILMVFIYITGIPPIRKKLSFELFKYAHYFNIFVFILLIIHAKNCWKWFVAPLVVFVIEIAARILLTKCKSYGSTYIQEVHIYRSGVIHLVIKRPEQFKFKAGDYIRIKIPEISMHEYHPFTISSAPEQEDVLWLHIRKQGNWTKKLYNYFFQHVEFGTHPNLLKQKRTFNCLCSGENDEETDAPPVMLNKYTCSEETLHSKSVFVIPMENQNENRKITFENNATHNFKNLNISMKIFGPLGTPTRDVFHADHAILVAGGIGITPFASILHSIWLRYKMYRAINQNKDFKCKKLKKVHFIWCNQDPKAFEWFFDVVTQILLEQTDEEKFIEVMLFATRAKTKEELMTETFNSNDRQKIDIFLRNMNVGRPKLDKIFADISNETRGDIQVKFCGPNLFAKDVKTNALKYNFKFAKEEF